MWPFKCRFRGMIKPGMGLTFDDSKKIADRKSVEMLEYLRTRRAMSSEPSAAFLTILARRKERTRRAHLKSVKVKRLVSYMRPLGS